MHRKENYLRKCETTTPELIKISDGKSLKQLQQMKTAVKKHRIPVACLNTKAANISGIWHTCIAKLASI